MFGSEALDVGIGVILFFLIVSLISSAIREGIETIMRSRSRDLERGLREMFDDPTGQNLTKSLFSHGQIYSLFAGDYDPAKLERSWFGKVLQMPWTVRHQLPSYIPAGQFATALMDIIARGRGDWPYPVDPSALTVDKLRAQAGFLPSGRLQRAVLVAIDHGADDLATVKANLEQWFDGSMDRVSGWYKRRTQKWLFAIGLAAAAAMNLDTVTITSRLIDDKAMRAAFVAEAGKVQAAGAPANGAASGTLDDAVTHFSTLRTELDTIGAPVGWESGYPGPQSCPVGRHDGICPVPERFDPHVAGPAIIGRWMAVILGWLVTAGAVTIGAPFWFDLLNKFMVIRSTVKPHEKSGEEASEDRTADPAPVAAAIAPVAVAAPAAVAPQPLAAIPLAVMAGLPAEVDGFEAETWAATHANPGEIAL